MNVVVDALQAGSAFVDEEAPTAAWPDLRWRLRHFDRLSLRELQHIYAARQRVFALEQQCLFVDVDGCDERAHHLAAWSSRQREPLAYARILEPGVKYADVSIGRVVTAGVARGQGLGREAVRRSIVAARLLWPDRAVRISAQSRLEAFYGAFGFVVVGPRYLEDGIEHTEMVLGSDVSGPTSKS